MKILHTADWHLGKRLDRFERRAEQVEVLEEICEIADQESVDVVLIAGDLFDAFNPPTNSVEDFYRYLKRLTNNGQRPVVAIAGNHDSPQRIEVPEPLARECGIIFMGYPNTELRPFELPTGMGIVRSAPGFVELKVPGHAYPLRILATPYANEVRLKRAMESEGEVSEILRAHWKDLADTYCDDQGVNLLLAHLFFMPRGGEAPSEPDGEKPIHIGTASAIYTDCIPQQIQYTALGHLHRHQTMGGGPSPVVYSSSPLAYSFAEAQQTKYVILINAAPGALTWEKKALTKGMPLHRKRFSAIPDAIAWLEAHPETYVELTIETETYLSSTERRQLTEAHPRIVGPFPYLTGEASQDQETRTIDLAKGREELFEDYFKSKHGQKPNAEMMELFKEVLQQGDGA